MAAKKKSPLNYPRLVLQWGIMLMLVYMVVRAFVDRSYAPDYEAYCPLGGMQSLASYFNSHSLACSMTTVQIALGVAIFLGVLLFSKLFCSYICPIGTVTEWISNWGKKLKLQIVPSLVVDKALRFLKYALLFITFYYTVTASELFCRKFDPYYATLTGFSGDVNLWYALIALFFTIVGSLFVRQFWCKYLCPLGAATNIFVYALPASALTLLWVLLRFVAKLPIDWPWLLGAICLMGFLFEATTLRFFIFPPLRITRDTNICTNCKICDKKCPMRVPVSTVVKVEHIDCHLCLDCVVKCPEKGALSVNKRNNLRWLPAVATVLITAAAIALGTRFELPTISESWGDIQAQGIEKMEIAGLKSIKCFGSSRAFANHMKEVPGVLGVETYVKHHKAVIYYDPKKISSAEVKASIFQPFRALLNFEDNYNQAIAFVKLGIDRCFDVNDQNYLKALLSGDKGILAFTTEFGEPVQATIYYNPELTDVEKIEKVISSESVAIKQGETQTTVNTGFIVNDENQKDGEVTLSEFQSLFFETTDISFNQYDSYKTEQLSVYTVAFPQAAEFSMQKWVPYLISHCSNNDNIVRMQTQYNVEGPVLRIWFVTEKVTPAQIRALINAKDLLVHYPDKHTEKVENPFSFK